MTTVMKFILIAFLTLMPQSNILKFEEIYRFLVKWSNWFLLIFISGKSRFCYNCLRQGILGTKTDANWQGNCYENNIQGSLALHAQITRWRSFGSSGFELSSKTSIASEFEKIFKKLFNFLNLYNKFKKKFIQF